MSRGRWIALVIFAVAVLLATRLIGPAVPVEIRLLTGHAGTTFYEDGQRYKEIIERRGITVVVEETSGSTENMNELLAADAPVAAFIETIQHATGKDEKVPDGVESFGTLYLQPLWVFGQRDSNLDTFKDLSGRRIAAGKTDSDARVLAMFLLDATGIKDTVNFTSADDITPADIRTALLTDKIGAVIATGKPDSPLIDTLLRSPELEVLSVQRADAFTIRYPFLTQVRYPEGTHDLKVNIPDKDLQLLASGTELVVSTPFPPALADLLLEAAMEVHGEPSAFAHRGEFPKPETAALPLSRAAKEYYEKGPSKLQNILPFRLAAWINRFMWMIVAIGSAAVGIFAVLPGLLSLPFKIAVARGYHSLDELERSAAEGTDHKILLEQLGEVDRSTANIRVPMRSLEASWFELRQNIHDMRERL